MTPPIVRRAAAEDAVALTRLMLASSAYAGGYHAMIADYPVTPGMIARHELWLAEREDAVLGFYGLDAGNADLDLMFVADDARGQGIGAQLFAHMRKRALAAGLRRVRIVAHPPAAAFFRRMGAIDDGIVAPTGRAAWERPLLWLPIEASPFAATILTLYPAMFPGPLGTSLAGRALGEGRWSCGVIDIRDFATDKHRSVDGTPAGGGAGMVLRADVVAAALDSVEPGRPVLAMTPRGAPLTQTRVRALAGGPGVVVLCGRFEGFDERLFEARRIEEVSIGDYVLSGGEMAALVLLDACIRLLPGVMGAASSGVDESFETGLLEYPHYTRPQMWEGRTIPEVLRSGDHARIDAWRKAMAETDTRLRRPDLWERHEGVRVGSPSGARQRDGS